MTLISKEELEEMYWGEPGTEMGAYLIADELGCHHNTIYRYLNKYNIPKRPPSYESDECMTERSVEARSGENNANYGKDFGGLNNFNHKLLKKRLH